MAEKLPPSLRVGVYIDRTLWQAFRVACVQRQLSASKEIQRFIAQQLAAWQQATPKETDHA